MTRNAFVVSIPRALLVVMVSVTIAACSHSPKPRHLDIATTTSVVNSGLLDALLPEYQRQTGVSVRVHAAGSGRALEMLNDHVVDLVISHAPQAESKMLATHTDWAYQKIATNQFILVGPKLDPANVHTSLNVSEAFKRIAAGGAYFISRGDGSGTHERETELWDAAQAKPSADRLLISGAGMGVTLRQADERQAYTLTDDATFLQLRDQLTLSTLFANDPRLVNSYATIYPRGDTNARAFGEWLSTGPGRQLISDYAIRGTKPFTIWRADCAGDQPAALPCAGQ